VSLSKQQKTDMGLLLKKQIRHKLKKYARETTNMPFHTQLLGQERVAVFSFVHSINTSLGQVVFEQFAEMIAKPRFKRAIYQFKGFNNTISSQSQNIIQEIMDDLGTGERRADKLAEVKLILENSQAGEMKKQPRPRVDLFLESEDGTEYYFDLKTAKPNKGDVIKFKRTFLEWVAIRGAMNPKPSRIFTGLAIPYNPYEPKPYERWTFEGMFDLPNELKVADEFWDFLGGANTYQDLLELFEQVGIELAPEIDAKYASFSSRE